MSIINGRQVGGGAPLKTMTLVDENGVELFGFVVDKEVIFDADPVTDIRAGKVAATDVGVVVGEKVIPSYHTTEATKLIPAGSEYIVQLPVYSLYDYTKLQAIICPFNTSLSDSVSAEKIAINNSIYNVLSTEIISSITVNHDAQTINFGITNDSGVPYVLRIFTYKEIF